MSLKKPNFKPVKIERVAAALSKSDKRIFERGSKFLFAKQRAMIDKVNGGEFPKGEGDAK